MCQLRSFTYRSLENFASIEIGHRLVDSRPDDIFLASFPRSGNTWLRTILVNILTQGKEFTPEIRAQLIPGISIQNAARIRHTPSPRLIKTHSWYRSTIPCTVYLVRDGRDVLVSLYHYLITRNGKMKSFDDFFEEYLAGFYGQTWHENVASWFIQGKKALSHKMLIINFEVMKADTYRTIENVVRFVGIPASAEIIERAMDRAGLDKMREIEKQRKGALLDANQSFYRGGNPGEWETMFSPEQKQRFLKVSRHALELAGYAV